MDSIFYLRKFGRDSLDNLDYRAASLETDLIIAKMLNVDKVYLELNSEENIDENIATKIKKAIQHRKNSYPMAYILGEKEFMEYNFLVEDGILVPRDDTSAVIEAVIDNVSCTALNGLEIGLGSGIISIILLSRLKNLNMLACDINEKALKISKKNAVYIEEQSSVSIVDRLSIVKSDLFSDIDKNKKFDFIVSNPPYIETATINTLDKDVREYEPLEALDGGEDGLDFYRKIINQGYDFLVDGGFFAFEIGYNQYKAVEEIMIDKNLKDIKLYKDWSNLDRAIVGYK